ncbi:hypothetical protein DPMN_178886 [Dreissena polymorpha]|uniref:G-protein coupled receptors family 1 profile domain-containing protein n=2 Tax=Dreissena polymorpha TaxID=45954 RepID=A0A9D4ED13_DREPO|nr:hypothetical protein DPMN_178886 [Dreissena polymorpha]
MVVVFAVVGVSGNIPVLVIFNKRTDKKASNTFIKVLAFIDLLVCLCIMPYAIVYEHHLVSSDIACRSFEFLRHFAVMSSNLTLVAIALERYIAVCRLASRVSVRTIKKGIAVIMVISILMAVPALGTFAVVSKNDVLDVSCTLPHELIEGRFCHFTYSFLGKDFVTVYQIAIMVGFIIILVAIIVLYIIIYVVLWKKAKIREHLTKRRVSLLAVNSKETKRNEAESIFSKPVCHFPRRTSNGVANNVEGDMNNFSNDCSNKRKRHSHNELQQCSNAILTESKCENDNLKTCNEGLINSINHQFEMQGQESETEILNQNVTFEGNMDRKPLGEGLDQNNSPKGSIAPSLPAKQNKRSLSFCSNDKSKRKRYNHQRTARMLFLCTVIYFVTWVPFWLDIFGLTHSIILRHVYLISHATNPIVYGIVNRKVRKSIKLLFIGLIKFFCLKNVNRATSDTSLNMSISGSDAG